MVALQVLSDAKALAALPSGALLDGVTQARAAKGVVEVLTDFGPVQLKALPGQILPAIPDGAKLLFQVLNQGGEPQLRLLAINGRPLLGAPLLGQGLMPGGPAPNLLAPLVPGAALPGQPQIQPGMAPQTGMAGLVPGAPLGLTATLIRPATLPGQPPPPGSPAAVSFAGLPTNLPPGTQLTVRIAGLTPPGVAMPTTMPAPAAPATMPAAIPSPVAGQPPVPGQPLAPTLPAPPTASVAVAVPQPQATAALPPAAPPILHGSVIAHPPNGHAVVQTPIGTVALAVQADLPVGSGLRLEVVGPPLPPPPPPAAAARPEGLTAAGWPALTEASEILVGDRQALDQLMRAIPQAGPRLAASLSVFAAAQRSGDIRAVLGEGTTKALDKAGRKDVADRLKVDLEDLSADSSRPLGGAEWRGYTLPFMNGGVVDPIRLFVRSGGEDGKRSGGTGNEQRFVLDFSLSNLGRLQLDGLVRREEKLFDLIVRTADPLEESVRRDIMVIFADASELGGTKGCVAFHTGGRWVDPLPDAGPTRIEA